MGKQSLSILSHQHVRQYILFKGSANGCLEINKWAKQLSIISLLTLLEVGVETAVQVTERQ